MAVVPYINTMHDVDGYMRQYFPNGVMMECNKQTGHIDIIQDGKAVYGYDNVGIDQIYEIQEKAKSLKRVC